MQPSDPTLATHPAPAARVTSEMVEALAVSLWAAHVENVKATHGRWTAWEKLGESDREHQRRKARAHLTAALAHPEGTYK